MKKIIKIVILCCIALISKGQNIDTVFTSQQVLRIAYVIDSLQSTINYLQQKDIINENIIKRYEVNQQSATAIIESYKQYNDVQNNQVSTLQSNITTYQTIARNARPKFWEHPVVWFIAGAGTIYIASKVVSNVK